jgi:hypothetical protein
MNALVRWLLFPVSLLFQLITYIAYPFAAIYFINKIRGTLGKPLSNELEVRFRIQDTLASCKYASIRDKYYLNHDDTHNALLHNSLWYFKPELARQGLTNLVRADGAVMRRYPNDQVGLPVSGDCLSAWVNAFANHGGDKAILRKVARHYLKNCLGIAHYNGKVSARSSNGGVSYVFDGYKGINQPCFGPQYYTSAALFALCGKVLGPQWKLIYWLHWALMGGWLWWAAPILHSKTDMIYYTYHITCLNLHTIAKVKGLSWFHKKAFEWLTKKAAPANGNVQPILYALAYDSGALSEHDAKEALKVAQHIKHVWPQRCPLDESFYEDGRNEPHFTTMGHAISLLLKSRK